MAATHYTGENQFASCGTGACCATASVTDHTAVTCKRCLAALARRDREFRGKAKVGLFMVERLCGAEGTWDAALRFYAIRRGMNYARVGQSPDWHAARAIAHEEGVL